MWGDSPLFAVFIITVHGILLQQSETPNQLVDLYTERIFHDDSGLSNPPGNPSSACSGTSNL